MSALDGWDHDADTEPSVLDSVQVPEKLPEAMAYFAGAMSSSLRSVLYPSSVDPNAVTRAKRFLSAYEAWRERDLTLTPAPPLCDHCQGGVEPHEVTWPSRGWFWSHRVSKHYSCANGHHTAEVDGRPEAPTPVEVAA